jgi:hypothetical protein
MLAAEQFGPLDQRDVHLGLDRSEDHVAIGLDVMRAQVTTLRQGCHPTVDAPGADPTNGSRNRDRECRKIGGPNNFRYLDALGGPSVQV